MRPKNPSVTRSDYCQYLLFSQINYTLTNFAEQAEKFSHDAANRYLAGEQIRPHLVWARLKRVAYETHRTIYQVKKELLSDYLCQQLKSPSIQMVLA